MAIEKGNIRAMASFAYFYDENGNYEEMVKYYLMAIDRGDPGSMFNLALYYDEKCNDYEQMTKYYLMAIENGDPSAMNNLVLHYKQHKMFDDMILLYYKVGNTKKLIKSLNDLVSRKDQKISPQVLNIIAEVDLTPASPASPVLQLIHSLLRQKLDIIDLHFKYSLEGKGFQEAKDDFMSRVLS